MVVSKQVELIFPGKLKDKPVFYHIIKNFDVVPNIKEASFSTDTGWALVDFKGEKKALAGLFKYLESVGVSITEK